MSIGEPNMPTPEEIAEMNKSRKEYTRELVSVGAEIIPDELGESWELKNVSDEQISEARMEMESDLLEREKMEVVSKVVLDSYGKDIEKLIITMNGRLGGRAGSVSVWESAREQLAGAARKRMIDVIHEIKSETDQNSLFSQIAEAIDHDVFSGPTRSMKIPEAVDSNFSAGLTGYIRDHGMDLSGKDLENLETALRLAALNAQYKFFSWQHSEQTEDVIAMQEELARTNDEFDPARAGFFELRQAVENSMASIKLDFNTKPNYRYAYPEYGARNADCHRMLVGLSRVEARQFLKFHDIELSK